MEINSVVEALQATLSPQHRKQAEEKLTQVSFHFDYSIEISLHLDL